MSSSTIVDAREFWISPSHSDKASKNSAASIIPNPGAAPTGGSISSPVTVDTADFVIAAGDTIYSDQVEYLLDLQAIDQVVTNNGTLWITGGPDDIYTRLWDGSFPFFTLNNSGLIVVDTGPENSAISALQGISNLYNDGEIYALGYDSVILVENPYNNIDSIENHGLIAVQALTGYATAIVHQNAVEIFNGAEGQILVEGATSAVAIAVGGGNRTPGEPLITNDGLIEAHATGPGSSIAISLSHSDEWEGVTIDNSGTIRADYAIVSTWNTTTRQEPLDQVINRAGGLIEGVISLDTGNDLIENAGTIRGYVWMGEGDDTYTGVNWGVVQGIVDMDWGDDTFTGSNAVDSATGGRGNDLLDGGGGNDLLLGGAGDDVISGGAGADGLYGEWGRDEITTSGADWVEAAGGGDTVFLGDYTFEGVHGGEGFDRLVFAQGARDLDLSAILASGRVTGFESYEMTGDQLLVIRAADFEKADQRFIIEGTASDTLNLVDNWTRGADETLNGETYAVYNNGNQSVLVDLDVTVQTGAAMAAGGLDAVGGGSAPRVGFRGLELSSTDTYLVGWEVTGLFEIASEEVFFNYVNSPVFFSQDPDLEFINRGTIASISERDGTEGVARAEAIFFNNIFYFENTGYIGAYDTTPISTPDNYFGTTPVRALWIYQGGQSFNNGTIEAYSQYSSAIGVDVSLSYNNFVNSGSIAAISDGSYAIGLDAFQLHSDAGYESAIVNTGAIYAEGYSGYWAGTSFADDEFDPAAIGIRGRGTSLGFVNDGTITATVVDGSESFSVGIFFERASAGSESGLSVTNNGTIDADYGIYFDFIDRLQGEEGVRVTNNGLITGAIMLTDGWDIYSSENGNTAGLVQGFAGNDTFIGGSEADWFQGGLGNDLMDGGAGLGDTADYSDAPYGTTVDLSITVDQGTGMGRDTLIGIENLVGSAYSDTYAGSVVANTIHAGAGRDFVNGRGGDDFLYGEHGSDELAGTSGNDLLDGGAGSDVLYGGPGEDQLLGGSDNDWLYGGTGADYMAGGAGRDFYVVDDAGDQVVELWNAGYDTVEARIDYTLPNHVERLYLSGSALNGTGNALDNRIIGNSGDNTLLGAGGDDQLRGNDGNDVLIGGAGMDRMAGGAGADAFVFGEGDFGSAAPAFADIISDFSQAQGDVIDLSGVDAIAGGGDDSFTFIGDSAFSGTAGELRIAQYANVTMIYGDTDGDGVADFALKLLGSVPLDSADFIF